MQAAELLERFHDRQPSAELPFVLEDEVEVLAGVYAARRGTVVVLAYAKTPIEFLVEFGDGTDEYFPASALKLLSRDV